MPSQRQLSPIEEQENLDRETAALRENSKQKEKNKKQTEAARKARQKKRKEDTDKKLRKESTEAEAKLIAEEKKRIKALRASITDKMILAEMRPVRRYNVKKKSYTDDADKLMHTIKSAELTILKEGYTPEPAILSLPEKGWEGPPIRGLRESKHGPYYKKPAQVPNATSWPSLLFFNGYNHEIFPVPPPPTEDAPIIEDEKWEYLLQQSRAYSGESATAISTLSDRLPLPPLDGDQANQAFEDDSIFLQALGGRQDRFNLVAQLKEMGLLQYDGHYDGLAAIYNKKWAGFLDDATTNTYEDSSEEMVETDPRCLWRDLHHSLNSRDESNQLRTQIQELTYHAFLAGMEYQKHRMLRDRQDDTRDAHEFIKSKKKGRLRKKTTELYAEITAAYYNRQKNLANDIDGEISTSNLQYFFPKSAKDIIQFICESDNPSWKKLIYIKPKRKPKSPTLGDIENKNRKLKDWIYREKKSYWRNVHEHLR